MCCGHKHKSVIGMGNPLPAHISMTKTLAFEGDTVTLAYIGNSEKLQTFYGVATGSQYKAGLDSPVVEVDSKDAETKVSNRPGLLEMKENGENLFKKVNE